MKLTDYLKRLSQAERDALAGKCQTSTGHLRNVAYGYRPCAPELAVSIEQHTGGQVTRRDLCPTNWQRIWPELANLQAAGQGA